MPSRAGWMIYGTYPGPDRLDRPPGRIGAEHWRRSDPQAAAVTYPSRSPRALPRAERKHRRGSITMSVLIIGKFQGDTAKFRQALTERAGEFEKIADTARAAGGIHH